MLGPERGSGTGVRTARVKLMWLSLWLLCCGLFEEQHADPRTGGAQRYMCECVYDIV